MSAANNPLRSELEAALVTACQEGRRFVFDKWAAQQTNPPDKNDVAQWDAARTIDAHFLRELALGRLPGVSGAYQEFELHPKGINFSGLRIAGDLDFENCKLNYPLTLRDCSLLLAKGQANQGKVLLRFAHTQQVSLSNCQFAGLNADGAQITGDLFLPNTKIAAKEGNAVRLLDATVGGVISANGADWQGQQHGLTADRAKVTGGIFLHKTKIAAKEGDAVRLLGATVGGNIEAEGADWQGQQHGLAADRAKVTGNIFLRKTKIAAKEGDAVWLLGATVGGNIEADGADWQGQQHGFGADGAKVTGDLFLRNTKIAAKEGDAVRLLGATVGGVISADGADWQGQQDGLAADDAEIEGSIFLRGEGTKVLGEEHGISAPYLAVGAAFDMNGLQVTGGKAALSLPDLKLQGDLRMVEGFKAIGEIDLAGAAIGGRTLRHTTDVWLYEVIGYLTSLLRSPARIMFFYVALWLAGWGFFSLAASNGLMEQSSASAKPSHFSAKIYSLELLFPFLKLHVLDAWQISTKVVADLANWRRGLILWQIAQTALSLFLIGVVITGRLFAWARKE